MSNTLYLPGDGDAGPCHGLAPAPGVNPPGWRCFARTFSSHTRRMWIHTEADPGGGGSNACPTLICAARGARAEVLRGCLDSGLVAKMADAGLMLPVTEAAVDDYPIALAIRLVAPQIYCFEWCSGLWRDAAHLVLRAAGALLQNGLILDRADPDVVQLTPAGPRLADPAAIAPANQKTVWSFVGSFARAFIGPLRKCNTGGGAALRLALRTAFGVGGAPVADLADAEAEALRALRDSTSIPGTLQSLSEAVDAAQACEPETAWSRYYRCATPLLDESAWSKKQRAVSEVLRRIRPATAVDIGANTGWFARLAALRGAAVVALDADETCMNRLHRTARSDGSAVFPAVMDICDPSPGLGADNLWYPPAAERLRSECVIALAITHHLALSNTRLGWGQIAECLARWSTRYAITEFVHFSEEANNPYASPTRPDPPGGYSLDRFLEALGKHFREVCVVPDAPHERRIIVCER